MLGKNKAKKKYQEGDFWVLILAVAISLFGVIMDFSASYYVALSKFNNPFYYLRSALLWFVIGWAAFIITANINYRFYRYLAAPALVVGFVLLALLFTPLGKTLNNATRWIEIGPITIMPGEIMKSCVILFFAWFYSEWPERIKSFKWNVLMLGIAGVAGVMIYSQPNLSTAITVVIICAGIMFLAGLSWWYVIGVGGLGVAGVAGILILKGGYFLKRVIGFWNPFVDPLGDGYQVVQGLLAVGSGGFFGIGLGNSIQKAFYLPEPQSDFILAIIGEELGLFGIICLMFAYLGLCFAIFSIAIRAKDKLGMLLAGGVGIHLGIQVILNIAVVTASMPATGIALPLVTLGGNSTMLFLAELGIVYNVSKQSKVSVQ